MHNIHFQAIYNQPIARILTFFVFLLDSFCFCSKATSPTDSEKRTDSEPNHTQCLAILISFIEVYSSIKQVLLNFYYFFFSWYYSISIRYEWFVAIYWREIREARRKSNHLVSPCIQFIFKREYKTKVQTNKTKQSHTHTHIHTCEQICHKKQRRVHSTGSHTTQY